MILVLHNPRFIQFEHACRLEDKEAMVANLRLDNLRLVANVITIDPQTAYRLTNTIEQPWWENNWVRPYCKSRSTSIGDILITSIGAIYVVMPYGFTLLEEITTLPQEPNYVATKE